MSRNPGNCHFALGFAQNDNWILMDSGMFQRCRSTVLEKGRRSGSMSIEVWNLRSGDDSVSKGLKPWSLMNSVPVGLL